MPAPLSLTSGERVVLARRRQGKFGRAISQRDLAKRLGVTRRTLQLAEDDQLDYAEWPKPLKDFVTDVTNANLKPNEHCFLLRVRNKESQISVGLKMGVTRYWVAQMELGREDSAALVAYYKL